MKASINSQHHLISDWLRELDFYKMELEILRKRLEEVAAKNNSQEVMAQVEHFQNRFIILKEQHDILHHENGVQNDKINELAKMKPEHVDEKFESVLGKMHDQMTDYYTSFRDTRFEFNNFLMKVM